MRFYFWLIFALALFSACSNVERDNPADPGSEHYAWRSSSSLAWHSSSSLNVEKKEFTDVRDGKIYKYVQIDNQIWMAENLNYSGPSNDIGKCYNEIPANCDYYGRLYDWRTAMNLEIRYANELWRKDDKNHPGICPNGWRIPNDAEWTTLVSYAGGNVAGTKLKARSGWDSNNGTDDYGFSALPGGMHPMHHTIVANRFGLWWTSTEINPSFAYRNSMGYNYSNVSRGSDYGKNVLLSIRCIKSDVLCNNIEYDTHLKFCFDNEIYDKCNSEVYNPTTAKCKNNILLISKCGDDFFDSETHFCNSNVIYEKCNGETYNPATAKCENDILLTSKCGDDFFDSETHFCNSNVIYGKCNGETYNPATNKCDGSILLTKCGDDFFDPETHFCNSNTTYEKCNGQTFNPATAKCEEGILLTSQCGGVFFNNVTHFCSSNTIYERCNGQTFNPTGQICEDGVVKTPCGLTLYFDEKTEFCHNQQVYPRCNNQTYDPASQKCENNVLLSKCGSDYYNPITQFCIEDSSVYDKCNNKEYDPAKLKCENNTFLKKCGTIWYDTFSKYCVNDNLIDKGEFTDVRDGKKYKYVEIGTQTWMAENLNYNANGSRCYGNNLANCEKYGRLYDWAMALDIPSWWNTNLLGAAIAERVTEICPAGWRLPNLEEWTELVSYAGGNNTAVEKLKTVDHWASALDGTDEFGFSVLPSGSFVNNYFTNVERVAYFWTTTEFNTNIAYSRCIAIGTNPSVDCLYPKISFLSIRCLKND
ncbi:MAG: hypothetical protein LBC85_02605 [Fibromonadaceae bacterium]|nr:hypothetical protein [Fibromonadaceae bacterium]